MGGILAVGFGDKSRGEKNRRAVPLKGLLFCF